MTKKAGRWTPVIQTLGRRTLEIYVIQMAVLAGLAMVLFPARFVLFQPHWAPAGLLRFFL